MTVLKLTSFKLSLFLVCGILLGHSIDFSPTTALMLVVTCFIVLGILFFGKNGKSMLFGFLFSATTICLGILCITLAQPKNWATHYSHCDLQKEHTWHIKIQEVLKSNAFSDRYVAVVKGSDSLKTSGKIIINHALDTTGSKFKVDDELVMHTNLSVIKQPLNPHQFNYAGYLQNLGIYHEAYVNNENYFRKKTASKTPYGIAAHLRNNIISKLQKENFGNEELAIIQALLLGQRNHISKTTYTHYQNAGAVHILALSGLHIGILLLMLQFLLKPLELLPKGKTIKLVVIVAILWGFAFLAGFSASIIRAVAMFTFLAYAMYLNRPTHTFNILALSLFFILLVRPMLLFQVGFQMSYAAVFAIAWIYPLLQGFWTPKMWVLQKGWQLLSVSIAAQLGVLPISLFYFHQFPGLFFISNLLIVPFLGVLLGIGILTIVLSLLHVLPSFLVTFYNTAIHYMNTIVAWVAQQEAFIFKNISFDIFQLVILYFIIFLLAMVCSKISFQRMALALVGIIAFQFHALYQHYLLRGANSLLLLHQTRNTIILHQTDGTLHIRTNDKSRTETLANQYAIKERVGNIVYDSLKNSYIIGDKKLVLIDSLGVYTSLPKTDVVVLTQSPKINLERLIDSIHPKTIIADGSNYRSYVDRWKKTCLKRKLPFHYTGEEGAYYFY